MPEIHSIEAVMNENPPNLPGSITPAPWTTYATVMRAISDARNKHSEMDVEALLKYTCKMAGERTVFYSYQWKDCAYHVMKLGLTKFQTAQLISMSSWHYFSPAMTYQIAYVYTDSRKQLTYDYSLHDPRRVFRHREGR